MVLEDFIRDHRGRYSASPHSHCHVCVDRNVITGQNAASTLTAVQNLILMANNTGAVGSGAASASAGAGAAVEA